MRTLSVLTLATASLLSGSLALAAVPSQFTIQGVLRDGQGKLESTTLPMRARFFSEQMNGQQYSGDYDLGMVPVVNGLFVVTEPAPAIMKELAAASDVWLEVEVNSERYPRQKVTSQIFALMSLQSDNALKLGGIDASGYQRAINTDCGSGKYVQKIDATGTVSCGTDQVGNSGTGVTSVVAHGGLTGAIMGSTLDIGTAFKYQEHEAAGQGTASYYGDAFCADGETLVTGGCRVGDINFVQIIESYPRMDMGRQAWHCTFRSMPDTKQTNAWARVWCLAK